MPAHDCKSATACFSMYVQAQFLDRYAYAQFAKLGRFIYARREPYIAA